MSERKPCCFYAVYDVEDACVFVGSSKECAEFMNLTIASFYSNVTRTKQRTNKGCFRYRAYQIEEGEE